MTPTASKNHPNAEEQHTQEQQTRTQAQQNQTRAQQHTRGKTSDNIVLIGMPGAGKSTIGVVLAKILNYDFVDVDLVIQQRCDKTLQRLIDALGPDGFINVENEVLLDMDFEHTIISTGGSAVYSHDAITHLADIGHIVYLRVGLDELKSRLCDFSERGVVMRREGCTSLEDLYGERVPLYEKYADVTVDIDGLSITESAQKAIAALEAVFPANPDNA